MSAAMPLPPPRAPSAGPLAGLRIVDISRVVAGNMLSLQFADLGADVVKVETPGSGGDPLREWRTRGVPVWWRVYSRNKRSLTLNLRDSRGLALFRELLATADALVENFRPGTLERMGLGPDVLLKDHPRLVIARISGWGQTGPYRGKPGFGSLVEAYCGLASKTGDADRPPLLPNTALADMITGLYGFGAVMAALHEASSSGLGQVIDLSLFEAMLSVLGPDAADAELRGHASARNGSRSPSAAPRNVYRCVDGAWVALSATTQGMTERLLRAIGHAELIADPRFADNTARLANVEALDEVIQAWVGARSRAEVLRHLDAAEVTMGPVLDARELLDDAYVRERGSLVAMPDPDTGTLPMHEVVPRFSRTPGALRRPAPAVGADTTDVLRELGVSAEFEQTLRDEGVV
jgi:formyl-CoA transferase